MFRSVQTFLSTFRNLSEEGYERLLTKPISFFGKQGAKTRQMFLKLPPASAATIYPGILWVIPGSMVGPYLSLYMVRSGLSQTEVGVYQSLALLIGLMGLFLGGYLSDVWGRKKSLVFFDALTWGGYCLCLALATNKWWCVAAIGFLGANQASGPAYQCLLIEGAGAKARPHIYTVLQIANIAPILFFFPLLGGFWVEKRGLIQANHEMYWFFTLMTALGIGLRWKFLPHSGAFEESPRNWIHAFRDALRQYRTVFVKFFKKRIAAPFLFSKFLDEWMIAMWGIYWTLYFVDRLGLKESSVSILVQAVVYITFVILFLIMPHVPGRWIKPLLGVDQVFGFLSLAVILFWTHNDRNVFWICLFSNGLFAVSGVLYNSVSAAVWMSIMAEKERAKVVAVSTALIVIGRVAAGSAGAVLYGQISPLALIWTMLGLKALNFVILRWVSGALRTAK